MQRSPHRLTPEEVYSPWRVRIGDNDMAMVIRDKGLSNLISFVYPRWEDPKAAAKDFIDRLKEIRKAFQTLPGEPPLVTVALNGIGTWANYPDGGYAFLEELYRSLEANNHGIKTTSVPEYFKYLTKQGASWPDLSVTEYMNRYDITGTNLLTEISPTAWHDGNFDPWTGKKNTDKAWTFLASIRSVLAEKDPGHTMGELWEGLYGLEAGDYFVELGKENQDGSAEHNAIVNSFRGRLRDLYRRLNVPMPNDPFFELRPLA
jgi:alpha-amylase/alpha-mannosidase (GH57 family)